MPPIDQDFEAEFCRLMARMLSDEESRIAFEERVVTLKTDFGDIRFVPNRLVPHDLLVVEHNGKRVADVRIDAPD